MWVLNCNSGPQGTRGRPRCLHGARASPCTAEDLTGSVLTVFVLTVVGRAIAVVVLLLLRLVLVVLTLLQTLLTWRTRT